MSFNSADYTYKVLQPTEEKYIHEAASVLTDTFLGVHIGSSFVQEPMMESSKIKREAFKDYLIDCLKQVSPQGLTVIAVEKSTDKVVGAVVSEYSQGLVNTQLLEGDLSAMNIVNLTTDRLINRYIRNLMLVEDNYKPTKYVHLFLLGMCLEYNKKYLAKELGLYLEEVANEKGVKVVYTFSSNYRSQDMFKKMLDYKMVRDLDGNVFVLPYRYEETFNLIPSDIAVDGQLLEKRI